ncbi:MAG: T9SS type A sorting domain-containing protein [Bacteroidales bacterium]
MRKFTLVALCMLVVGAVMAQSTRVKLNGSTIAVKKEKAISEGVSPVKEVTPFVNPATDVIEEDLGTTNYDLQSNSCSPYGRLYVYPDGTKAGVWTIGKNPTAYPDRGTGYNYYNGTQWGPDPTARIETVKTGWPSYAPCGPNGEIVIAHQSGTKGLWVAKRENKGTGTWTEKELAAPAGASGLLWPRMISTGPDHNTIHVIALTAPTANGGTVYQGLDGAVIYCKSEDGGETFGQWQLFPELSSSYYLGFGGDSYSFLIPYENHIAFVIADNDKDLIIMHSADNGDTWEKTIVWEHPYPFFSSSMVTDKFYCPDGSAHGAIDKYGRIHLAFGVNRAYSDGSGSFWFPWVDGVAYWNSDMPTWLGGDTSALNPDTLYNHGNLIGWMQDINGNGELDLVSLGGGYSLYYLSPTSMPQLIYDNENDILYCAFVSVTETFNNGTQDYRHIWARISYDNGATWGDFIDLTGGIFHIFDECVFPSISPTFDNGRPALIYQRDNEPGLSVRGDSDPPTTNYITYMVIDNYVGVNDSQKTNINVSQNYPNPAHGLTRVMVNTNANTNLSLTLTNLAGQKVMEINKGQVNAGTHIFDINTHGLTPGIYFYTVNAGTQKTTLKMMVK